MSLLAPLLAAAWACLLPPADDPPGPRIRLADDGAFEVSGLDRTTLDRLAGADAGATGVFDVSVVGAEVPMLGRVRLDGDRLRFEPRFAPRPGTRYRATFRPALLPGGDPLAVPIEAVLELPGSAETESARVEAVYPSAEVLPENLLRFYLHFSAPMSRGEAYRRIRLVGPDGSAVFAPFLELDEELWDPSGTRLTLLIDPGRIKQGLVPREELGPVLMPDRRYALEVDAGWPDASGRPLAAPFRKDFRTGPADETPPDPSSWRLDIPAAGTRDPLVVILPEPLDHALLGRLLRVVGAAGDPIRGQAKVTDGETRWAFTPGSPWLPGAYQLVADTDLEDLAGNGIGRPFEVDVFDRVEDRVEARTVALPFRIGPAVP